MAIFEKGGGRHHGPGTRKAQLLVLCQESEQVGKLIAGPPNVYICDECVDLCNDILEEAIPTAHDSQVHAQEKAPLIASTGLYCALCRFPIELGASIIVPDRGPLCLTCLDAIRAVAENSDTE